MASRLHFQAILIKINVFWKSYLPLPLRSKIYENDWGLRQMSALENRYSKDEEKWIFYNKINTNIITRITYLAQIPHNRPNFNHINNPV